jgi:hypothetical protein
VIILTGLFLLPLTMVNAASKNYNDNLIEFSLSAGHQDTQFNFAANSYMTSFDIVGINWYEPFTQYFHAGIEAGSFNMTQASNSLSSAQFTKGQYAGLLLRFIPLETHYLKMNINLNYRYSQSDGASLNQSSQFAWHESLVTLEVLLRLSEVTRFFMEAEYHRISGEQRDSGAITQISRFSEQNNLGYRLGLDFRSDRNDIVRLNWLTGYRDGAEVQFIHKF